MSGARIRPAGRRRASTSAVSRTGAGRLRAATARYLAALRVARTEMDAFVAGQLRKERAGHLTEPEVAELERIAALLDYVHAALEVDDAPGTPASIAAWLRRLRRP